MKAPAPHGDRRLQILLVVGALLLTAVVAIVIVLTRPSVRKQELAEPAMPVKVAIVEPTNVQAIIEAFGTVEAGREVSLKPEVSGKIVELASQMEEGGLLEEGQFLLRIDPRDFEAVVQQERAAVERAEFELRVEEGRQVIAQREWELLGEDLKHNELSEELALRKPHLKEKKAALIGAKSRLNKARIDLERTTIEAPFNAKVLAEDAEVGQLINPQTTVARLVATDQFYVRVSIPYERLHWLQMPSKEKQGSTVTVSRDMGQQQNFQWKGNIRHLLGDVDPQGRLARLLVAVPDPLQLEKLSAQRKQLLLGTYVRVAIQGPMLENVFVVPRQAVHEENIVWLMTKDEKLELRQVHVLLYRANDVVVDSGLASGEAIVISPLPVALPGMKLTLVKEKESTSLDE